eukprot:8594788-Alexandrium_andersonii.AAC.1
MTFHLTRQKAFGESFSVSCCALRVLEANLATFYAENLNPASVGLGIIRKSSKTSLPRDSGSGAGPG